MRRIVLALAAIAGGWVLCGAGRVEAAPTCSSSANLAEVIRCVNEQAREIDQLRDENRRLRADYEKRVAELVGELNREFRKLAADLANGATVNNAEPATYGGGRNYDGEGHCPAGQIVVGIQPYKSDTGIREIRFRCGILPVLSVK